jgi:enoyl-CoA hydratase/carnithine racemase
MAGNWTLEIDDSVAVITYTHSDNDLLSFGAVAELADLLDAASAPRDEVSVVMVTGADGRFLPDVDRDELTRRAEGGEVGGDELAWHRVTTALRSKPQPTIAAIDGNARGGACLLALACTLRIGSERSLFGPVKPDLGIIGTETSAYLVRLVGPALASELLLTQRELNAEAARQLGLINDLLPAKGFAGHARDWCQRLMVLPPATVFAVKRTVEVSTGASRDAVLAALPPTSQTQAVFR